MPTPRIGTCSLRRCAALLASIIGLLLVPLRGTAQIPEWQINAISSFGGADFLVPITELRGFAVRNDTLFLGGTDSKVQVFTASGQLVRTIGGAGEGPGEFRMIAGLGFFGDTLWVYDAQLRRTAYFTASGRHIRTSALTADAGSIGTARPLSSNRFLITPSMAVGADSADLIVADAAGRPLVRLPALRLGMTVVSVPIPNGQRRLMAPPIRFGDQLAFSPDGRQVVALHLEGEVADPRLRISRYDVATGRHEVQALRIPPEAVTAQDAAGYLADMAAKLKAQVGSEAAAFDAVSKGVELPKYYPAAFSAVMSADGGLWIGYGKPKSAKYVLVSQEGLPVAKTALEPGELLIAASLTTLWTHRLDNWGVPVLTGYRITAPTRR